MKNVYMVLLLGKNRSADANVKMDGLAIDVIR